MYKTSAAVAPALPSARPHPVFVLFTVATLIACLILSFIGYLRPVVMGIVQGLGEFLPISSSAHLILTPWFLGWQGGAIDTLTFDVALHLGTLVAVLGYFWRDWVELIRAVPGWVRRIAARDNPLQTMTETERLLSMIVIATIPGGIAGVLLDAWAEHALRSPLLLACTLPVLGVLLYGADRWQPQQQSLTNMSWREALWIGLAQACAIIPGVSRSGVTITAGRFLKLDRIAAARFSFLLSAPITAAAVVFKFTSIITIPSSEVATFIVGVIISGAVGALAIGFLLSYIRRASFGIFAAYRVALAIVIIIVYVARLS